MGLFLPLTKSKKDISKATISRWISMAIKLAYEKLTSRDLSFMKITAHEVRAVSTSWAYFNNCSLKDIMAAACWRNESTFSSFYLRSLQEQANDLYARGDLYAAQLSVKAP